jgi:hypothetical protein
MKDFQFGMSTGKKSEKLRQEQEFSLAHQFFHYNNLWHH